MWESKFDSTQREHKKLVLEAVLHVLDKQRIDVLEVSTFDVIRALLEVSGRRGVPLDPWLKEPVNIGRVMQGLGFEVRRKPHARKRLAYRPYVIEALAEIKKEERDRQKRSVCLEKALELVLDVRNRYSLDSHDFEGLRKVLSRKRCKEARAFLVALRRT